MEKNKNRISEIALGIAIIVGLAVNDLLSTQDGLSGIFNWFIAAVVAAVIHRFLFWLIVVIVERSDFFLALFWGKLYVKGFWSYTYYVGEEKKYGAWCIDQNLDTITIKGFGLTQDGARRSDVQSMTSLIQRGNDYEVINMRRDINNDGNLNDIFYYSKTTLHLHQRTTFMNLFNHPLQMDGNTIIYGGELSGTVHSRLTFVKRNDAKNERELENIIKSMMH